MFYICQLVRAVPILCLILLLGTQPVHAQFAVGGVYVDAAGMLQQTSTLSADERLELVRASAFAPPASRELSAVSPLRKVSLRRLEQQLQDLSAAEKPIPADIRYLAGMTRITHVFFYPEAGDVVIAGPAEGWGQAKSGDVLGLNSRHPPLELDDLAVALRYAFSETPTAPFLGCSIQPTAAGMQNYAAYMRALGGIDRSRIPQIFSGMEKAMGPQSVRLFGVPGSSRLALKLLAADYRLKRIALGHDPSPAKGVVNYLDLAAKRLRTGPQRQHRWWFVGEYDAVYHTADDLAFELDGQGVRVATAPTAASNSDEKNSKQPQAAPAARQFATAMTTHFTEAAARVPIFAELQNLIGLAVAAELIAQRASKDEQSWRPTALLDEKTHAIATAPVPQFVPSLANYRLVKNRHWLISISGGVEIYARSMTNRTARQEAPEKRQLPEVRTASRVPDGMNRWWWD